MSHRAKFLKSALTPADFPKGNLPEIALIGRSNAGKSSLINFMFQTKGLAKTSAEPGKTRLINFFDTGTHLFVDLPGWGFAKASKAMRQTWGELLEAYLSQRQPLCAILFLLDIRRYPSEDDLEMVAWFRQIGLPLIFVLTKADKVNQSTLHTQVKSLTELLGSEPVVTSAKAGRGREHLLKRLKEVAGYARLS